MPMYQQDQEGVAPPGWEETIKKWKRHTGDDKKVENPWALAWYLKKRGVRPLASADEEFGFADAAAVGEYAILDGAGMVPRVFLAAANGEGWAHAVLLSSGSILHQEL